MTTAWVLMDYQNVHYSAWETFTSYGTPMKDATLHPMHFANQAAKKHRQETQQQLEITKVIAFRGVPSPRKESMMNGIVTRQHNSWRASDRRVEIRTRPLRYLRDWPETPAEEKGVDVLMAITLAESAINREADLFIVATRDTDFAPAVEMAERVAPGCVEIVSWFGASQLTVDGVVTYNMGEAAYRASRDIHDYGADVRAAQNRRGPRR